MCVQWARSAVYQTLTQPCTSIALQFKKKAAAWLITSSDEGHSLLNYSLLQAYL